MISAFYDATLFAISSFELKGDIPDGFVIEDEENDDVVEENPNTIYQESFDYIGGFINPEFILPEGWVVNRSALLNSPGIDSIETWRMFPSELSSLNSDMNGGGGGGYDSTLFSGGVLYLTNHFGTYDEQLLSQVIDVSNRDSLRIQMNLAYSEYTFYAYPEYDFNSYVLYRLDDQPWDTLFEIGPSTEYVKKDPDNNYFDGVYIQVDEFVDTELNPSTLQIAFEMISGAKNFKGTRAILYADSLKVSGISTTETTNEEDFDIPSEIVLNQNYPNPFNPSTNISFTLPESGEYLLEVFNMLGQRVSVLTDGRLNAGSHTVSFNAAGLSSGVYTYRLTRSGFSVTKKMLLIK